MYLDLAHSLYRLRSESDFSEEDVGERSGLSVDEIRMIEKGDTSSLTGIARLCNALNASLTIDSDFTFKLSAKAPIALRRAAVG